MTDPGRVSFGRIDAHGLGEDQDAAYPMRLALEVPPAPPLYNYWDYAWKPLNQLATGTCVAHGLKGWMLATPIVQTSPTTAPMPYLMYRDIVLLDEWAENDQEAHGPDDGLQFGTSVRAAFKWAQMHGYVAEYRWASNIEDVALWIATKGPVVAGTLWYEGMMDVDAQGYIHPTGGILGGHCYVIFGVNFDRRDFTILNSWPDFGIANTGRARITFDDLDRLLFREGGEAAAGLEVPLAIG